MSHCHQQKAPYPSECGRAVQGEEGETSAEREEVQPSHWEQNEASPADTLSLPRSAIQYPLSADCLLLFQRLRQPCLAYHLFLLLPFKWILGYSVCKYLHESTSWQARIAFISHVVCPKYGVCAHGNFSDIFNMADYPKIHPAWYLYVLLTAEVQRAELIFVPKANLAWDHRIWYSVVHFFCLSSALQERKSQQPWGFPCSPGLHSTLQQSSGLWAAAHRECLSINFHAPKSLLLRESNGDHFKSALAEKCLYTEKHFCELLMAALQLIYVKESWATDESGSNKMICKRPHSKQQGGREPGTKSMLYCALFCQCKNPMPACKRHYFLCSKSRQRDKHK